ncbi:hypothetical protein Zmor_019442 [Zophobas morio]|uniref:Uncharacterized protein n=1 Tax=Zophobas morio TaxID=2755281 RepID=A0AA38M8S2_9CUCU|nr:hypothetical protein Zmor_019442 [Zophobas morio]
MKPSVNRGYNLSGPRSRLWLSFRLFLISWPVSTSPLSFTIPTSKQCRSSYIFRGGSNVIDFEIFEEERCAGTGKGRKLIMILGRRRSVCAG